MSPVLTQCTDSPKKQNRDEKSSATTDDQWQENSQNHAAGIGFMGTHQSDAIEDDPPDRHNETAAERNNEQGVDRANRKTNDTKCGFKRLLGTADNHQTQMQDRRVNKNADDDEQRGKNDEQNPSDSAEKMRKRIVPA